jgi:hypothetical protein
MVVFVDLGEDSEPPEDIRLRLDWHTLGQKETGGKYSVENVKVLLSNSTQSEPIQTPCRTAIAEAMGCYPYVKTDIERDTLAKTIFLHESSRSDH